MILHVWERAKKSNVCDIFVATPDEDIANEIKKNGGHVISQEIIIPMEVIEFVKH